MLESTQNNQNTNEKGKKTMESSLSMIFNPAMVRNVNGVWVTDSLVIAREFGRDHRDLCRRTIVPYESEIAGLMDTTGAGAGRLLPTDTTGTNAGRLLPTEEVAYNNYGQTTKVYLLNEDQTAFVVMLMNNGAKQDGEEVSKVVKVKQRIIMAFANARKQLGDFRKMTRGEMMLELAKQELQLEAARRKTDYFDYIFGKYSVLATDIARFYGVKAHVFNKWLEEAGFQSSFTWNRWRLSEEYRDRGLAAIGPSGHMKFTAKGQNVIHEILQENDHTPVLSLVSGNGNNPTLIDVRFPEVTPAYGGECDV